MKTKNFTQENSRDEEASERSISLLLVSNDTFQTAKQADDMELLLTRYDSEKTEVLGELIKKHVNINEIT